MDRLTVIANELVALLWAVWMAVWCAAALFVKRTQRRERLGPTLLERVPILIGFFLFLLPHWMPRRLPSVLTRRLMDEPPTVAIIAVLLVFGGVLFSVWARAYLGRNWSGEVMVKIGHTLITSGPYRWVRHPIYSGLGLALIGTALASGTFSGFLGLAFILFAFLVRVRQEEALMRQTFPGDYVAYSGRTARLIPGIY